MNNDLIVDDLIPSEPVDPAILLSKETEQDGCIHVSLGPFSIEEWKRMTGWCPFKNGTAEDSECHFDGYCSYCSKYPHNKNKENRCDTCKHENKSWPCADCFDYRLWEAAE